MEHGIDRRRTRDPVSPADLAGPVCRKVGAPGAGGPIRLQAVAAAARGRIAAILRSVQGDPSP